MRTVWLVVLVLFAWPAAAQVQIHCQQSGDQTNCTGTTTTPNPNAVPPGAGALYGVGQAMQHQSQMNNLAVALQNNQAIKTQLRAHEFRVEYCRENPNASMMVPDGETISCAEELRRTKAECTVDKWKHQPCKKQWKWLKDK